MQYGELTLGQTEAIVNKLGGMEGVQHFLAGELELKQSGNFIDCDADPLIPRGFVVESHQRGGMILWTKNLVELFHSERNMASDKLRAKLDSKLILNANVLDFLLKHTELIPDEWKGKHIAFFGTVYRDPNEDSITGVKDILYYPFIRWEAGKWNLIYNALHNCFLFHCRVALRAS